MSRKQTRRRFIATSAAIGAGYWVAGGIAPRQSLAANEEIRFACVGVNGKGQSDSGDAGNKGKVVAICDIDEKSLDKAAVRFEGAKKYFDYRKMFDEAGKDFDAVTVSTPDHMHAPIAAQAIRLKKHAFVQKPLSHSIFEARTLSDLSKEYKVATQMGNQGTANNTLRECAMIAKQGHLGKVKEVHVWTNRPVWPQRDDLEIKAEEAPAHIHWPEFIGKAKMRPYSAAYHPFKWRGFWDFGTGALGDMACHTVNMPFMALNIRDPLTVQAVTAGHKGVVYPAWSEITFEFPAIGDRQALVFKWYDGGKKPSEDILKGALKEGEKISASGCAIVGDKDTMYCPGDYCENGGRFTSGNQKPKVEWTHSPGHFEEWVRAIKGGEAAVSNFDNYAGPLTETILLGNLAVWAAKEKEVAGKKIEWDAKTLTAKNAPEVMHVVKSEYHNGYTL